LKFIDNSNAWLTGRIEEEPNECVEENLILNDDYLTWGNVARVARAEEKIQCELK
jgi:hypothetical protein